MEILSSRRVVPSPPTDSDVDKNGSNYGTTTANGTTRTDSTGSTAASRGGSCSCRAASSDLPVECATMGQVIDMYEGLDFLEEVDDEDPDDDDGEAQDGDSNDSKQKKRRRRTRGSDGDLKSAVADVEKRKQQIEQERAARKLEIQVRIQNMSTAELLNAVLEAQQQRVATYRTYNRYVCTKKSIGCFSSSLLLYLPPPTHAIYSLLQTADWKSC